MDAKAIHGRRVPWVRLSIGRWLSTRSFSELKTFSIPIKGYCQKSQGLCNSQNFGHINIQNNPLLPSHNHNPSHRKGWNPHARGDFVIGWGVDWKTFSLQGWSWYWKCFSHHLGMFFSVYPSQHVSFWRGFFIEEYFSSYVILVKNK